MSKVREILGRPELRILLGMLSLVLFVWPVLALEAPLSVFRFIFGSWTLSVLALFLLSLGQEAGSEDGPQEPRCRAPPPGAGGDERV